MGTWLKIVLVALGTAFAVTPVVRYFGQRVQAYGGAHRSRGAPHIARFGGLTILFAIIAAWAVLLLGPGVPDAQFESDGHTLFQLLVPAALILALGMYDDLAGATPQQKLLVEAMAGGTLWWAGIRITSLPILGYAVHTPLVSFLLTTLWIIAVINSFNLIDGLDGLATGVALPINLSLMVISVVQPNRFVFTMTLALTGALLGFLKFNFAPASIYLGDTGSLFLGFILGALSILSSQNNPTIWATVVPFAAFGLPLFETLVTVARRSLSGQPLFSPDLNHIHHRLLQKGLSPRLAALALSALAAVPSLGSAVFAGLTENRLVLMAAWAAIAGWFLTRHLRYEEFSELGVRLATWKLRAWRRLPAKDVLCPRGSKPFEEARG